MWEERQRGRRKIKRKRVGGCSRKVHRTKKHEIQQKTTWKREDNGRAVSEEKSGPASKKTEITKGRDNRGEKTKVKKRGVKQRGGVLLHEF